MITSSHLKEIDNGIFHIMDKGTLQDKQELLKFMKHHTNLIKKGVEK